MGREKGLVYSTAENAPDRITKAEEKMYLCLDIDSAQPKNNALASGKPEKKYVCVYTSKKRVKSLLRSIVINMLENNDKVLDFNELFRVLTILVAKSTEIRACSSVPELHCSILKDIAISLVEKGLVNTKIEAFQHLYSIADKKSTPLEISGAIEKTLNDLHGSDLFTNVQKKVNNWYGSLLACRLTETGTSARLGYARMIANEEAIFNPVLNRNTRAYLKNILFRINKISKSSSKKTAKPIQLFKKNKLGIYNVDVALELVHVIKKMAEYSSFEEYSSEYKDALRKQKALFEALYLKWPLVSAFYNKLHKDLNFLKTKYTTLFLEEEHAACNASLLSHHNKPPVNIDRNSIEHFKETVYDSYSNWPSDFREYAQNRIMRLENHLYINEMAWHNRSLLSKHKIVGGCYFMVIMILGTVGILCSSNAIFLAEYMFFLNNELFA
ncbi:hypothetical protein NEMIN01_0826 [Nematocida minor]|uniref:uncharacterized protein n=1 Tax=Nematocida minor TaxID=1912983 RepID=UPI00221F679B|nr:uncharacterized protein NEMIN01_0826 [Nematocida minor]KAI5190041.1 hypothetical protein NEMIN01_0826 [Nematocida minor]